MQVLQECLTRLALHTGARSELGEKLAARKQVLGEVDSKRR